MINRSFASFISFARTDRKPPLTERTCPPKFPVRWVSRGVGVRHSAPCLLEGLKLLLSPTQSLCFCLLGGARKLASIRSTRRPANLLSKDHLQSPAASTKGLPMVGLAKVTATAPWRF